MEREVEGAKVGELKRGVTAPGMNGMNMRPCQALPPLCEALPQLVADKHWESNQVSTRPTRASLTVRILRYEIEKGLGAVYPEMYIKFILKSDSTLRCQHAAFTVN